MIVIFTYNREALLKSLVDSLKGEKIMIIDDGSDYPIHFNNYHRYEHQGKEGFWQLWNEALRMCHASPDNWFLFLQDDVTDVNLKEIKRITRRMKDYAFNIMNRGPDRGWTKVPMYPVNLKGVQCQTVRYVDCIFATNRQTLDKIGWKMNPVSAHRFRNPYISSGVGHQLSQRFAQNGILMYKPIKSLAFHGDHESLMHKEERKRNPLISI